MHYKTLYHGGVSLPVEYEFDEGSPETRTDPADPPAVILIKICLNGVWVDPDNWIFPEIVDKWCEQLLEQHE
jgi:hypothetical protein